MEECCRCNAHHLQLGHEQAVVAAVKTVSSLRRHLEKLQRNSITRCLEWSRGECQHGWADKHLGTHWPKVRRKNDISPTEIRNAGKSSRGPAFNGEAGSRAENPTSSLGLGGEEIFRGSATRSPGKAANRRGESDTSGHIMYSYGPVR